MSARGRSARLVHRLTRAQADTLEAFRRSEEEEKAAGLADIERILTSEKPDGFARRAICLCLNDDMPQLVYRLWQEGRVTGEALECAVAGAWTHSNYPLRVLGEHKWLQMFRATGFFSKSYLQTSSENEAQGFELIGAQPTQPLSLWRGAPLSSKGRGMSWTTDRKCAHRFALEYSTSYCQDGAVFQTTVSGHAVLAVFASEYEPEYVINPNMLRGRVSLDEVIPGRTGDKTGLRAVTASAGCSDAARAPRGWVRAPNRARMECSRLKRAATAFVVVSARP